MTEKIITYSVVTFIVLAATSLQANGEVIQEALILKHILNGYNADVRPELAHAEPLPVTFEMKLQKIVKLDVKEQSFVINAFIRMRWTDLQLRWNLSDFEEIEKINVGTHLVWTPDVVLYNTATDTSFSHLDLYKTKVLLNHTGEIVWTAPVTWKASCKFDVTWFPIDRQICSLTFGSWTYMSNQLSLSLENKKAKSDHHDAFGVKSGEWEIEHVQKVETNVDYDCCPNPFSTIQYTFTVRRMALYYFLYIILPLVAQVFLFFVIFHIPNDGGERTGFGVTILLSITVYLLVLSDQLPEKSDDRPMLGLCFIVIFYVLSIALVCAACIVKLVTKKTRPPKWLLQLSGASNKLCCLSKKSERDEHQKMLEMSYMNGKDGITQHNNGEEDEEEFNNKLWVLVCDFLDKFCFYFFLFIVILAPIIIVASLDKTMLGT